MEIKVRFVLFSLKAERLTSQRPTVETWMVYGALVATEKYNHTSLQLSDISSGF